MGKFEKFKKMAPKISVPEEGDLLDSILRVEKDLESLDEPSRLISDVLDDAGWGDAVRQDLYRRLIGPYWAHLFTAIASAARVGDFMMLYYAAELVALFTAAHLLTEEEFVSRLGTPPTATVN
jgi:hypothetical protein